MGREWGGSGEGVGREWGGSGEGEGRERGGYIKTAQEETMRSGEDRRRNKEEGEKTKKKKIPWNLSIPTE